MSEKVFCLRRYFGGRYFGGRYFVREDILAEGILSEKVFRRRRYFVLEGIMSGYCQIHTSVVNERKTNLNSLNPELKRTSYLTYTPPLPIDARNLKLLAYAITMIQ